MFGHGNDNMAYADLSFDISLALLVSVIGSMFIYHFYIIQVKPKLYPIL